MSTQLLFRISVFALVVLVQSITFASVTEADPDTAEVVTQKGIREKRFAGVLRKNSRQKGHTIKGGDMLKVTLNNGDTFCGRYSFYTYDSIGIYHDKDRFLTFPKDEIKQLEKGKKRTLVGLELGLLIGAAIGYYIYEAEEEQWRKEMDRWLEWRPRISSIAGSIHDANSPLRHYPRRPDPPAQPNPALLFGPPIVGAVLGAIIGGKIYTYKRISIESTRFSLECIRF